MHQEAHRAYLRGLKEKGVLIASGPMSPRFGGMCLLRVPEDDAKALDAIRDNDPFVQNGVAQYELIGWAPVIGKEDLRPAVTITIFFDGLPPDQVFLDDALENGRIARADTTFLPDTRPRSARLRRFADSWLLCGAPRPPPTGRAV